MLIVMKEAGEQIYLKYNTLLFSIKQSKNTRESPFSTCSNTRLIADALINNYYIHVFIDEVLLAQQSQVMALKPFYLQTQEDCQKIWTL